MFPELELPLQCFLCIAHSEAYKNEHKVKQEPLKLQPYASPRLQSCELFLQQTLIHNGENIGLS